MMATTGPLLKVSDQRKRWPAESCVAARSQEERQTMSVPEPRSRPPKPLAAGVFQPEIGSFRLCLAAEGKSGKTVRMYTEAVQWFAAAHLLRWPDVCSAPRPRGHRGVPGDWGPAV